MSKSFTGTLSVGATTFNVTATLAKRGLRVVGHIVFDLDTERVVPVNFSIDAAGTSFTTPGSTWFTDPNGDKIELFNLTTGETIINSGFTQLNVNSADCAINGVVDVFGLDLDADVVEVDNGGLVDNAEAVSSPTRKSIEPIRINEIGNYSDHYGGVLSLKRLVGESNIDYTSRIRDVIANPASSTYQGLINGINRELGLTQEEAIRVTMVDSPSGDEDSIRFYLDENDVIIYEDWVPIDLQESGITPTIEMQTSLEGMTVGKLVDWINTSANYQAELLGTSDNKASHIVKLDSRLQIQEEVPGQEIMVLGSDNIIPGTVTFESTEEMDEEIDILDTLTTKGQYQIDYSEGHVKTYTLPPDRVEFTYTSNRREFVLNWSPVKITDFTSEGGQDLYFEQVTREFYTSEIDHYVNGLPTNEAYGIMRDILTAGEFPQFWGE